MELKMVKEKKKKEKKEKKRKSESVNGNDVPKAKKRKHDKQSPEEIIPDHADSANGNVENGITVDSDKELDPIAVKGDLEKFDICEDTKQRLKGQGVKYLFPVQAETFQPISEGKDVVAQARTGTGKTLAFSVPVIEKLKKDLQTKAGRLPSVLIMAPTRELAKQTADVFEALAADLSVLCVYGGTPYGPQENKLWSGVDVVVGTPGRILDMVQKGTLKLENLKYVVLDEVDRMLDMGFAEIVDDILKSRYQQDDRESNPQTLLFSATLPHWVNQTAKKYMSENMLKIDLVGRDGVQTSTTVQHLAIKCSYQDRASIIGDVLQVYSGNHGRAMVFCQTKRDADELAVSAAIKQETHVLHGDIPQEKREMVLQKFREGRYRCLITTDVAARGLDIPEVDLVIQCSPPKDVDSYIHRSGRTGRAGRTGTCVLFYKPRGESEVFQVERKAGIKFKKIGPPSAEDIIKSAADDAVKSLETIPEETIKHFMPSAEKLIAEQGALRALSSALAALSGSTSIKSRSLLSSQEGFTAYLFRTNITMNSLSYAWRSLERHLSEDVKEKIKGMRFLADKMGCVFDLPTELETVVEDHWCNGKYDTLEKATELPEILQTESSFSGGNQRGYGRGDRQGFGNRNNWRGGGGGYRDGQRGFGRGGGGRGGGGRGGGGRGGSGGSWGYNKQGNSFH